MHTKKSKSTSLEASRTEYDRAGKRYEINVAKAERKMNRVNKASNFNNRNYNDQKGYQNHSQNKKPWYKQDNDEYY